MKSKFIVGVLLVIFGIVVAVGPQTIFSICETSVSEDLFIIKMRDDSHMKCWYTGNWETVAGSIVSLLGLVLVFLKNNKAEVVLFIAVFVAGVFALLIPTLLVGVCGNVHMDCRVLTLPALIIFSSATILTSFAGFVVSFNRLRRQRYEK